MENILRTKEMFSKVFETSKTYAWFKFWHQVGLTTLSCVVTMATMCGITSIRRRQRKIRMLWRRQQRQRYTIPRAIIMAKVSLRFQSFQASIAGFGCIWYFWYRDSWDPIAYSISLIPHKAYTISYRELGEQNLVQDNTSNKTLKAISSWHHPPKPNPNWDQITRSLSLIIRMTGASWSVPNQPLSHNYRDTPELASCQHHDVQDV